MTILLISVAISLVLQQPVFAQDDQALKILFNAVEGNQKDLAILSEEVERVRKSAIPLGAIVYFRATECPNDAWRPLDNARGRYLVALNKDGVLGATVGEALGDKEQRSVGLHAHGLDTVSDHIHGVSQTGSHSHSYRSTDNGALLDNGSNFVGGARRFGQVKAKSSGAAGNHSHAVGGAGSHSHGVAAAGTVPGTNAPYIQLLVCEKIR